MAHIVETQWMGKMQFNALVNGHTIIMDGRKEWEEKTMALFQNLSYLPLYQGAQAWMWFLYSASGAKR